MTSFANAVQFGNQGSITLTENGMPTNTTTTNPVLDFFFVVGSSRGKDISEVFLRAFNADELLTLKALFHARDVRHGLGERDTFRKLMLVLEQKNPSMVKRLLPLVAEYGRWDDLLVFKTAEVQTEALNVYAQALRSGNGLAAKWAPRKGAEANMLRKAMKMDPKTYRKTVVGLTQVVETQMCAKDWSSINYEHVPSVAGARYQKAFNRNDPVRYSEFKTKAVKGEVKMNAGAVYPYDVIKSVKYGDQIAALAQWQNLPNYLGDDFILPMVDVSGSMNVAVGGNDKVSCMDVAVSLGLYLADKQSGAFKDMFLTFSGDSKIQKLEGNLLQKLNQLQRAEWGMNTSIERAFREILRVATMGNVPQNEMPKMLIVFTDLEFDQASDGNRMAWDMARKLFESNGYTLPSITWWNLRARPAANNNPVTQHANGSALVSGFSPNILKSILACETFTPANVMMEALNSERYAPIEQALSSVEDYSPLRYLK